MARASSFASLSNQLPPLPACRERLPRQRRRPHLRRGAATILVCYLGRCRWLKRWRRLFSAIMPCGNARLRQRFSGMTTGSSLWQLIFVSFALVLILFEVVRGWRRGVVRQVVRLFALGAAYAVAFFGGRMLLPLVRPIVHTPDVFISTVAGAILALVVYAGITTLGAILFKSTGQQSAGIVCLLYGVCGAALGVFFGLLGVWLMVVAIRSVGAIANGALQTHATVQHQPA